LSTTSPLIAGFGYVTNNFFAAQTGKTYQGFPMLLSVRVVASVGNFAGWVLLVIQATHRFIRDIVVREWGDAGIRSYSAAQIKADNGGIKLQQAMFRKRIRVAIAYDEMVQHPDIKQS
jgi:hypothetical protein